MRGVHRGCVRQGDLLAMTQQLATLFEAGLPLDRALSILEEHFADYVKKPAKSPFMIMAFEVAEGRRP